LKNFGKTSIFVKKALLVKNRRLQPHREEDAVRQSRPGGQGETFARRPTNPAHPATRL